MKSPQFNFVKAKLISLSAVLIFAANISYSQVKTEKITIGEKLIFKSEILNEERTILISFPQNYENADNKFPVLFLLDGRNHYEQATGASDYLSKQGLCPGLIVVAITNVDRNRDFTPTKVDRMPTSGGGLKFHNFIEKELIPHIENTYKASGYNILMGHSLGGIFTAYSLLEFPGVFESYIAVSPYMQFDDKYIINLAKTKLKANYKKIPNFYMTVGDEPDYLATLDEFSALVKEKSDKAINFMYVQLQGENHATTPYLTLFNGLRFVFSDWMLPKSVIIKGIDGIDEHFAFLSKKYGYKIETPENTINRIGYNYLQIEKYEEAINIFKENVKRFPNSANVYDSLGEAYEKSKQYKFAVKNYQKAYDLGLEQNHVFTEIFKKNLDRANELAGK